MCILSWVEGRVLAYQNFSCEDVLNPFITIVKIVKAYKIYSFGRLVGFFMEQ